MPKRYEKKHTEGASYYSEEEMKDYLKQAGFQSAAVQREPGRRWISFMAQA